MTPIDLDRLDPEARNEYVHLTQKVIWGHVLTQAEINTLQKYDAFLSTPVE
jgi:hypothetical protein